MLARPCSDALVPRKGPRIAGLFVRPDGIDSDFTVDCLQDLGDGPDADHQRCAALLQRIPELPEAIQYEAPLSARYIGLSPVVRFDDIEGHHDPLVRRLYQRSVIVDAQIALEPDNLSHGTFELRAGCRRHSGLSGKLDAGDTSKPGQNVNIMSILFLDIYGP